MINEVIFLIERRRASTTKRTTTMTTESITSRTKRAARRITRGQSTTIISETAAFLTRRVKLTEMKKRIQTEMRPTAKVTRKTRPSLQRPRRETC